MNRNFFLRDVVVCILMFVGGNVIKVWDVLTGGRLLASFSNHHKTITSLCFASNNSRLVSASLDRWEVIDPVCWAVLSVIRTNVEFHWAMFSVIRMNVEFNSEQTLLISRLKVFQWLEFVIGVLLWCSVAKFCVALLFCFWMYLNLYKTANNLEKSYTFNLLPKI